MSSAAARFVFATCQNGAEGALKQEVARAAPEFRFSYSRPGFVTFRLPDGFSPEADLPGPWTFARSIGLSLGKAAGASEEERIADVARAWSTAGCSALHVFPRDRFTAGHHGYTPGPSPFSQRIEPLIRRAAGLPHLATDLPDSGPGPALKPGEPVLKPGDPVLDCVLVEDDQWWLGRHRVRDRTSMYPGGFWPLALPEEAVSRAWLKMEEALLWSALPLRVGDLCAEIGCAPGGSSQSLLGRGMRVMGIDPAEVAPPLLENPNFTWVRKRGHEARIRDFRPVRWLMADMNVPPDVTLETVERIVTHSEIRVTGLLLTLKLSSWELADELPQWLKRVRSWGYSRVEARQLQHNRMELCVAAERRRSRAKRSPSRSARRGD